ncbi:MAG: ammonium transporter [Verrucomicrobiae bacterium]|nr:ammonium transporter [Verrucomicrobiae bacterium]
MLKTHSMIRILLLLATALWLLNPLLAQTSKTDDIRSLQDEVRKLLRDSIDAQKALLEQSKSIEELRKDLTRLQSDSSSLQKTIPTSSSDPAGLEEIKKELASVLETQKALKESLGVNNPESAPAAPATSTLTPEEATTLKLTPTAINIVWTLLCGFLVMFMQAGFAMVETGFTRAKNATHTMAMNFMVYSLGMLGFWICGFAIMFGGTGAPTSVSTVGTLGPEVGQVLNTAVGFTLGDKFFSLFGTTGFFLPASLWTGGIFTLFLFQMVFMDTTATIPTGSMAERWKFLPFCIFAVLVGAIIYPLYGHWVWGGGWLAALGKNFGLGNGHVDFAGSSVVHLCGGMLALVGAKILGPRIGKFNKDGTANPVPGHNIPMGFVGTFILAFGWFGFNAGSTLAGMDVQIGIIATNTMLASMAGAIAGMITTWIRFSKPDPSFMCNGMLAGMVAITAPCAFVDSWAAVFIGASAGVLVVFAAYFIEEIMKIDDPVGAISVHAFNGAWGVIALGLFANGRYGAGWNGVATPVTGLFYGSASQFIAQIIGTGACIVAVGLMGYIMFMLIEVTIGNRATDAQQLEGMDTAEIGVEAYSRSTPTRVDLGR